MVFAFGLLFSLIYISSYIQQPDNGERIIHDLGTIPLPPKISQLQAMQTVERHIRSEIKDVQKIRLEYQLYNFSLADYNSGDPVYAGKYAQYRQRMGYSWDLERVKQHPELLNLPLFYVHVNNGTVYEINYTNHSSSYRKVCDKPVLGCHIQAAMGAAAKGRLVYFADILWSPQVKEIPSNEGYVLVDAETGKIVWSSIEYAKNTRPEPHVNINSSNKTINQLYRERASPPLTTYIDIEYGAYDSSSGKSYFPKEVRVTLGIDNKVVWTNRDVVSHSVISSFGYIDKLTGKKFDSGMILPGSTFEFVFTEPGEYWYHAEPHPWMQGKVEVVENFS
jgi:plastocyanin